MKYRCIKEFQIELVDEDGFSTTKHQTIQEGSEWVESDDSYRFIGGDVRLENEDLYWVEISSDRLSQHFESIEE